MKLHDAVLLTVLALAGPGRAMAQQTGDATHGHELSGRLCADCHAIERGAEPSPRSKPPTFVQIAATPGMTGIALSAWLHSSHGKMPMVQLDARTREDISAYILSLKPGAVR